MLEQFSQGPEVKADANQRTIRTIVQGAIATVLVAVLPLVYTAVANGVEKVQWTNVGFSAATAGLMALITYVMAFLKPAN